MAQFDPSVLSSIPDYAPDVMGSRAKGIQLADMIDQQQLGRLKLNEEKSREADTQKVKMLLKDADLSSFEGQTKAAQAITKVNPEMGMQFMKGVQGQQQTQDNTDLLKLRKAGEQYDVLAGSLDVVTQQLDAAEKRGIKGPQLDALAQNLATQQIQGLLQSRPDLRPSLEMFAKNPQNFTAAGVRAAEAATNRGQQLFKERIAEHHQQVSEAQETERERHDRAMESTANRRESRQERDSQGNLTSDAVDLAAQRLINGESAKDVLANFGRGKQGASDIATVQNRFAQLAREQNLTPDEIALRQQEMRGSARAELALGEREGKIAPRVQEAKRFAEIALKASDELARGDWKTMNQVSQWVQDQASGKELGKFQAANVSLINAYAAAIGGGQIHQHDQETGAKLLSTANGQENYRAKVQQLITETETALAAPEEVKQQWRETRARDAERRAGKPPAEGSGAPKQIASDSEYDQLPSGAEFIGPDGKRRRKP